MFYISFTFIYRFQYLVPPRMIFFPERWPLKAEMWRLTKWCRRKLSLLPFNFQFLFRNKKIDHHNSFCLKCHCISDLIFANFLCVKNWRGEKKTNELFIICESMSQVYFYCGTQRPMASISDHSLSIITSGYEIFCKLHFYVFQCPQWTIQYLNLKSFCFDHNLPVRSH